MPFLVLDTTSSEKAPRPRTSAHYLCRFCVQRLKTSELRCFLGMCSLDRVHRNRCIGNLHGPLYIMCVLACMCGRGGVGREEKCIVQEMSN